MLVCVIATPWSSMLTRQPRQEGSFSVQMTDFQRYRVKPKHNLPPHLGPKSLDRFSYSFDRIIAFQLVKLCSRQQCRTHPRIFCAAARKPKVTLISNGGGNRPHFYPAHDAAGPFRQCDFSNGCLRERVANFFVGRTDGQPKLDQGVAEVAKAVIAPSASSV